MDDDDIDLDTEAHDDVPAPMEVDGPDGYVYRIIAMRAGVPWWSQLESGGIAEAILEGVVVSGLEHRSRKRGLGWKVGVTRVKTMQLGLGLKHQERVEHLADLEPRMEKLAELAAQHGAEVGKAVDPA